MVRYDNVNVFLTDYIVYVKSVFLEVGTMLKYLLVLFIMSPTFVYSSDTKFRIKTHPVSLLVFQAINAELEILVDDKYGFAPAFYYSHIFWDAGVNANYYITNTKTNGVFVSTYLHYSHINELSGDKTEEDDLIIGVNIGRQKYFGKLLSYAIEVGIFHNITANLGPGLNLTYTLGHDF